MPVGGEAFGAVVQADVVHGAVREALDLPALLHGVVQVLGSQSGERDLAVLEEVERGGGVGGDVGVVDDVQPDAFRRPVGGVLLQAQTGAVNPAGDGERAVVEQILRIGAVAAVGGFVERLVDRIVGGEGRELVEIRHRAREIDMQRAIVHGANTEFLGRQFAAVHGLGVLDAVENEGVFGSVRRLEHLAPGEHEVARRHRFAVAPARLGAQPERRREIAHLPALGDSAHQPVAAVVAQQALHDVAENAKAHLIGAAGGIHLRRFLGEGKRHGAGGRIHCIAGAALVPLREHPQNRAEHQHAEPGDVEQLPQRAQIEGTCGNAASALFDDRFAHDATLRSRLPTTRFRCASELHSSAWWT